MTGRDLADKLRDWGFAVKSHMSGLEDSEILMIQGRLEAHGFTGASAAPPAGDLGGLVVRKKKKKKAPTGEPATAEPAASDLPPGIRRKKKKVEVEDKDAAAALPKEPAVPVPPVADKPVAEKPAAENPEPEPAAPSQPDTAPQAATPEAPVAPESSAAPAPEPIVEVPAPAPSEAEPPKTEAASQPEAGAAPKPAAPKSAVPEPAAPEPAAPEPAADPAPQAAEPESSAAEASEPVAAEPVASEGEVPVPASGAAEAPAPETAGDPGDSAEPAEGETPVAEGDENGEDGPGIVRPSDKRRTGKVVGFIDLSTIQPDSSPRRESRRLRSADDDSTLNVQPTRGGNPRRGIARSGTENRGALTAAELREREAGRFLRRGRPQSYSPRGGGGRRGGGGHSAATGSPYAGAQVKIEHPISMKKLADALSVKQNDVLRKAFDLLGFGAVNINSILDEDTAELIATNYDVELEVTREVAAEEALLEKLAEKRSNIEDENLALRTPTIAVLGHVDHGKTTLIDTIRASQIAGDESGGITQHIGAYQVTTKAGHKVTIVDTPGHAAFTQMRARGASAVDIVVLVIAADDGVMPQTAEAINHAKAAGTPIVVAMNKMDKVEANPEKVLNELAAQELVPEDWGGQTAVMQVSALKGTGIDELLERVFLEGELLELKSHHHGPASGVVLEAEIQQGRGIVAHLLIQDGSLQRGDVILAGEGYGKVRSMQNDRGEALESAGPSMPIEVTGLDKLPGIGEHFHVVPDLNAAKEVAEERARTNRMVGMAERRAVSRDNLFEAVAEQAKTSINLIVKADVQGSVEVLKAQLLDLQHEEVEVRVLHSGVGAVSESDVDLAVTSEATIMAFHVGTNGKARINADRGNVEIRNYSVLYELLDDVRKMMEGSLSPEIQEQITGHVEIRRLFKSSRLGNIAGSHVIDGTISRDSRLRLMRDEKVVFTGQLASLRREADEAKEVREGFDCGIVIKNYQDIQVGDIIEAFKLIEVKRTI